VDAGGAAAVAVVVLMIGVTLQRRTARMIPGAELAAAQKLAEWRAASDGLLVTPGQEILRTMPKTRRILSECSSEGG